MKMFVLDLNKCINCNNCVSSCFNYYGLKDTVRRKIYTYKKDLLETISLSVSCNHCKNPVCISICPTNRFYKRQDGIVVLKEGDCKDCRLCIEVCPYHAIKFNDEFNTVDKCNMCYERLDKGLQPICVSHCITKALEIVDVLKQEETSLQSDLLEIPYANYLNPSIIIKEKVHTTIFL